MDEVIKLEITNLKDSVSEIKEDTKNNTKAINEIVNKLVVVTTNLEVNTTSTEKLAKTVEDIKNKPVDTLDKVKIGVSSSALTGILMTVINKII